MRVLEASRQHSWCNYRAVLRICFSLTRLLKRVLQNWYVPNSWLFLLEPELNYGVFQDELLKDDAGKRVLSSAILGDQLHNSVLPLLNWEFLLPRAYSAEGECQQRQRESCIPAKEG